jgi:putative transposase
MTSEPVTYSGYRFPAVVIHHAIWPYHVFSLSLRDVGLILAERGVVVTHESIRQWCRTFGAGVARRLRKRRPRPGDTRHMDEVFIRLNGTQHYLWRAVDQNGVVLDILVQERRTPRQPSASSSACWPGSGTSRSASSATGCAATASPIARCCRRSGTGRAAT